MSGESRFNRNNSGQLPTKPRFESDVIVSDIYNLNLKTLRNWRTQGKGPRFYKLGRSVRYDLRDVEEWFAAQPKGGNGIPTCALKGTAR
jgi:predicted DNA-binding transcriptional regulator AlpA